jgi:hypothetical protein
MEVGFKNKNRYGTGRTTDDSSLIAGSAGDFFFPTLPTSFIESK